MVFGYIGYNIFSRKNKIDITNELSQDLADVTVSEENEIITTQAEEKTYKGKVNGKICYPSEVVPEGDLLIKNVKTEEILKEHFDITKVGQQQNFAITLNEGTYVFAYKPISNDVYGFFSNSCASWRRISGASARSKRRLTRTIKSCAGMSALWQRNHSRITRFI